MRKAAWIAGIVVLVGVAAAAVFETKSRQNPPAEIAEHTAKQLQAKIDAVKKARDIQTDRRLEQVEVSEAELASYVLFELRDEIPARLDSFNVQLTPGAIAADTQLTLSNTGNAFVDTVLSGTHSLFVKGRLAGAHRAGKFDLDQVKVDGIPVPKILIETLVKKYVKPKHPDVDLNAPFELPWRIDAISIEQGKATIVY